ncbi:hypothetical protein AnigIFM63604_002941 [Aspergillus niger]|uniref:Uncharacterized protein n=1 Tax=Aspergillus niger TaxID=5061 RepID=A0A9W6EGP8_ASPNG|nr:hypothetical protein AnigIFM63604_002941 [Aspergillus niger]
MAPNYHPANSFTIYSIGWDKDQLLQQKYPHPIEILDLENDVLFLKYSLPNPTPDTDVRAKLVQIMGSHGYSLDKKVFELPKGHIQQQDVFVPVEVREGVVEIFEKWEGFKMTEASATGGADEPAQEKENVAVMLFAVKAPALLSKGGG